MKQYCLFFLLIILTIVGCRDSSDATEKGSRDAIGVKFSPRGGITSWMVGEIGKTDSEVKVLAFAFTSVPISEALINAHKDGKSVEAVLDRENLYNKNSVMPVLYENGITIYIDDRHAIMHNKVIIIDSHKFFTGSFNLSKGAEENNAENTLFINNKYLAETYIENYELHKAHSKLYKPGEIYRKRENCYDIY